MLYSDANEVVQWDYHVFGSLSPEVPLLGKALLPNNRPVKLSLYCEKDCEFIALTKASL